MRRVAIRLMGPGAILVVVIVLAYVGALFLRAVRMVRDEERPVDLHELQQIASFSLPPHVHLVGSLYRKEWLGTTQRLWAELEMDPEALETLKRQGLRDTRLEFSATDKGLVDNAGGYEGAAPPWWPKSDRVQLVAWAHPGPDEVIVAIADESPPKARVYLYWERAMP